MRLAFRGTSPLTRPILFATALSLAGVAGAGLAHYRLEQAGQTERAAQARLQQTESELRETEAILQRRLATIAAWEQLQATGQLKTPQRTSWVEAIQRLRTDASMNIDGLDFDFAPEHPLTSSAWPQGLPGLREATLRVSADVGHEEHFLELLSRLRRIGLNTLQHCSLVRPDNEDRAGIRMRCEFSVLHIDTPA